MQVARFREGDLSRMRLEEKDQHLSELGKARREVGGVFGGFGRPTKSSDKAKDLPLLGSFLNLPPFRFVLKFFCF